MAIDDRLVRSTRFFRIVAWDSKVDSGLTFIVKVNNYSSVDVRTNVTTHDVLTLTVRP